jgi:hypothetical protein
LKTVELRRVMLIVATLACALLFLFTFGLVFKVSTGRTVTRWEIALPFLQLVVVVLSIKAFTSTKRH